jgi:CrcB protein
MSHAWFWVGLGGFLGSILRHALGALLRSATLAGGVPAATLLVNTLGCLAIGALSAWIPGRARLSVPMVSFLMAGLLGGFTTFSAFGNETVELWRSGGRGLAALNVAAQLALGLGAVALGRALVPGGNP